ncbi:MAG: 16S rRNA (guanine(527)-N(7))-methyltransferase RsmG [Chloroflexi bacterium]|nr:16S rRNA (guanine(527)-N(7))-methyltransferase RsmG [Chloroflexota bacterium]
MQRGFWWVKGQWYNSGMEKLKAGAKKLGLELNSEQLERFDAYYRELVDWNQRINLTAITDYEEVQIKHFLDSLTIALAWQPARGNNVIDVGTGAGMPGIPLKIAFPDIKLVLLEATAKKVSFLHHIKEKLGLNDVEIIVGRAEEVAHVAQYRERFDLVLSRAVAPLPTLVELTLPFAAIGGSFIAQKKGRVDDEISRADKAIGLLGGGVREVKKIELAEFADERCLIVIDKIAPTPEQYPRRPGVPGKKPL